MTHGVMTGLWTFYSENGRLEKEIDENAKFGPFGPDQLLLFLEKENLINLKTGEGLKYLNIGFGSEQIPNVTEMRKTQPGLPDKWEWSVSYCKSVPACDHTYLIDSWNGKVISHRNIKGVELVK